MLAIPTDGIFVEMFKEKVRSIAGSGSLILAPSHQKLSLPIIERFYKKMRVGLRLGPIQVHEGLIIDGHHRYVAAILSNSPFEVVPSIRSSAKNKYEWHLIELDEEDWALQTVNDYNRKDARALGISERELLLAMDLID